MVRKSGEIGSLVAAIARASQTQRDGIAEVREAIAGLDQAAQRNAETVQDVTAAAHLLQEQSAALADMLLAWRLEAPLPLGEARALQAMPTPNPARLAHPLSGP